MVSITGPFGQETTLGVDADGFLESIANPASESYQFDYDANGSGLMTAMTDPNLGTHTYDYDDFGRLAEVLEPGGGSLTLDRSEPSIHSFEVLQTTELGRQTLVESTRFPDESLEQVVTHSDGTQSSVETAADQSCRIVVTEGTVVEIENAPDPRFHMDAPVQTNVVVTAPGGGPVTSVANGRTVSLADAENPFSLLLQSDTTNVNGKTITKTYTSTAGKKIVTTSPLGREKTQELDNLGREVKSQTAGLHPVRRVYDTQGRPIAIKEGPDPDTSETRTTILAYWDTQDHRKGLLASVTDALGRTIELDYDEAGRITWGKLPDDRIITATYDDNGNLTSITPPGRPAHEFLYTPMNQESKYEPPSPEPTPQPAIADPATYYGYNDDGQMETITRPDGGVITFLYDDSPANTGQLLHQVLPTGQGQIDYTYYPSTAGSGAGLPQSITAPDGGVPGTPSGSVERVYTQRRQVLGQTVNLTDLIAFGYDDDGLMTTAGAMTFGRDAQNGLLEGTILGDVSDAYVRNDFGEVTDYTAVYDGTPVAEVTYERDAAGRIESKTESLEGETAAETHCKYDDAGRLYRVCDDDACATIRAEYIYDDNSNRTGGFDEVSGTITATYDTQDRLLTYNGASYAYTANGELTSKTIGSATTTYAYDALGNLRHVELPDGTDIDYLIDGKNRRIGKKVDGSVVQAFLYEDQLRPVAELDATGTVVSRFVYGDKVNVPEYMVKGGVTYRLVTDHLGSPRLVIDVQTGTVAQRLDYDAFGNVLTDTNEGFQPFGFAGGIYDHDTGLVRFGARDYDTWHGHWTMWDPMGFEGGGWNLRGYALQDPVNVRDPDGLQALSENGLLRAILTRSPVRLLFGGGGYFNKGQYLRIGTSRDGGEMVLRIAGSWVQAITETGHIILARLGPL